LAALAYLRARWGLLANVCCVSFGNFLLATQVNCVSFCTFVLVKHVIGARAGARYCDVFCVSFCTFVLMKYEVLVQQVN
jgi:hypothetical protein